MELSNTLNLSNQLINNEIVNKQNNFLTTTIGKVVNGALNVGIRALLPNVIEDQVIGIKDAIINNGFKEGVKKAINSAINLFKSTKGIATGEFEDISQAHDAIKTGGTLDGISSALNFAITKANQAHLIPANIATILRNGKDVLISSIESNIEDKFNDQINAFNLLSKYENNWKNYYGSKDFQGMEKEYKKIEKTLNEILPVEKTIIEARKIQNMHNLIKNKGGDFNVTQQEIELANKLIY